MCAIAKGMRLAGEAKKEATVPAALVGLLLYGIDKAVLQMYRCVRALTCSILHACSYMLCFHAAMQASMLDSCAHICSLNVAFL